MPIFDQGYQHWSGALSGHAWRWLAITRHDVRTGTKGILVRLVLLVAWSPALALAFTLCLWGLLEQKSELIKPFLQLLGFMNRQILADPRSFRVEVWTLCYQYFLAIELRFSMILILLVGPNLISQDLRFNALPLYFSRPLRRIDYFAGKLGVIAALMGMVVVVPSLVAYVLGLLFSLDITIVKDTLPLLLSSLAYGLVIAFSAGMLILALSSLSRNSRYVILLWLGLWFVSNVTSWILIGINFEQRRHEFYSRAPETPPDLSPDQPPPAPPMSPRYAQPQAWQEFQVEEFEAAKTDWRPLVSYTTNLARVGQQLLGTQACWERIGQVLPAQTRPQFLIDFSGPRYPWHWSAAVLAVLFGISACILNFRVKSLDRLK